MGITRLDLRDWPHMPGHSPTLQPACSDHPSGRRPGPGRGESHTGLPSSCVAPGRGRFPLLSFLTETGAPPTSQGCTRALPGSHSVLGSLTAPPMPRSPTRGPRSQWQGRQSAGSEPSLGRVKLAHHCLGPRNRNPQLAFPACTRLTGMGHCGGKTGTRGASEFTSGHIF